MKCGYSVDVVGGHMKYVSVSRISYLMLTEKNCFALTVQFRHVQFCD